MPENDGLSHGESSISPASTDTDGRSPRKSDAHREGGEDAHDVPPAPEKPSATADEGGPQPVTIPLDMTPAPSASLAEAEALYRQGMSHYQRREWAAALEYFTRLKELEPARPALDALLDEVRWFIQLEAIGPQGATREQPAISAERPPSRPLARIAVALLALVGLVLLAVTLIGGGLLSNLTGGEDQARVRELLSLGQSRLAVEDYEGARMAFQEVLTLLPGDPQAQAGLRQAEEYERLSQRYQEALEAMSKGDWETAATKLAEIRASSNPGYKNTAALIQEVERQKELAALFVQAVSLYDQGRWEEAIAQLEKLRSLDPTYRADAVTEDLFVSYLNDGREKLARAGTSTGLITQAIERFGSALALRPFNRQASDERRLANIYYEAVQAFNRQDWAQARTRLEAVRSERADYAGGQVTVLLYQAYIGLGDAALRAGNAGQARTFYELAAGLAVPDRSAAEDGLDRVAQALATATPTVTPLPPTPAAVVATEALNVRAGPGINFPVIGVLKRGDTVAVLGRTPKGDWLRVCCLAGGESGWLSASLVETSLPATAIPIATEIPNTPTPTPTRTGTPSPLPTASGAPQTPAPPQPTNPPPPPPPSTPTPVPTATLPPPPTNTPTRVPTDTPPPPPTNTPTPPPR
jgi:outer membrane protein assembly factor BamD (BamD/ComL family)/uncharacterized protein YraI